MGNIKKELNCRSNHNHPFAIISQQQAYIACKINGTITVNAGGTLTVQFAQAASNGSNSSILVGSTFVVTQIS